MQLNTSREGCQTSCAIHLSVQVRAQHSVKVQDHLGHSESSHMQLPCCRSFEKLRSVREMEYELDFVTNRANRDTQACYVFLMAVCASMD